MRTSTKSFLVSMAILFVVLVVAVLSNNPVIPRISGQATAVAVDPCFTTTPKSSAFANITTATTTALVTVSGTTQVFVCSATVVMTGTTTADTLLLEQGTGATCAGSPTAISPTFSSGVLTSGATVLSMGEIKPTTAGTGVCAVSTVGTGPTIGVLITFVQQ